MTRLLAFICFIIFVSPTCFASETHTEQAPIEDAAVSSYNLLWIVVGIIVFVAGTIATTLLHKRKKFKFIDPIAVVINLLGVVGLFWGFVLGGFGPFLLFLGKILMLVGAALLVEFLFIMLVDAFTRFGSGGKLKPKSPFVKT